MNTNQNFEIPAKEITTDIKNTALLLRQKASDSAQKAYSPYSSALVGSAIQTESGEIFGGCNVENSSYGGTVCAERVAIWKAVSEGHRRVKMIYIFTKEGWPPCGMCRQVLSEFAYADCTVIIGNEKGDEQFYRFADLLPLAFTPDKLGK